MFMNEDERYTMKIIDKNSQKRKQLADMLIIAIVSIVIIAHGRMLIWMKLMSILLVILFLYGLTRKKQVAVFLSAMLFIICNLFIFVKYHAKWFLQTSSTINLDTGIYGSQITYKYRDWADVILPGFVGNKIVYIDKNNIYEKFFDCYSMEVRFIDCNAVPQEKLDGYLHMGPVYFQGYSYLFSEDEIACMDKLYENMGHYPQLYFENTVLSAETEVFCIIDNSNNIYVLSKEEYTRIMKL